MTKIDQAVSQMSAVLKQLNPQQQRAIGDAEPTILAEVSKRTAKILDTLELSPDERREAVAAFDQRAVKLLGKTRDGNNVAIRLQAAFETGFQESFKSSILQRMTGAPPIDVKVTDRAAAVRLFENMLRSQINDDEVGSSSSRAISYSMSGGEPRMQIRTSGKVLTPEEQGELATLANILDNAVIPRTWRERFHKTNVELGSLGSKSAADPAFISELQAVVARVKADYAQDVSGNAGHLTMAKARSGAHSHDSMACTQLEQLESALERLKGR